jgi:hypothetical protein
MHSLSAAILNVERPFNVENECQHLYLRGGATTADYRTNLLDSCVKVSPRRTARRVASVGILVSTDERWCATFESEMAPPANDLRPLFLQIEG